MIEISDIPKHWQLKKFEDFLDYIQPTPYIVESTDYSDEYEIPVLTAGKTFVLGKTNEKNGVFNSLPVIIFDDFTTATKFVNFPFKVKSSAMKILKPKNELVNIKFIFYYMQTVRITFDTHKRYWISVFSKHTVPSPPLNEQKEIVAKIEQIFSEIDKGIESLKTAQQQIKAYRQSVLKWAFEGKLTAEWRSRNQGMKVTNNFSDYSQLKVAEGLDIYGINNLPKEWKWVKLGEVCKNVEYGSATKSQETGEVPVLRMGNIQNGRFDWNDLKYSDNAEEIQKYLLRKDDVLFNRTNSPEFVGKTAIYKGEQPAIFAGYLIRINYNKKDIDPDYLNYYLNTKEARNYGNTVRSFGVNQSNINGTKLKTYPLPITSLE